MREQLVALSVACPLNRSNPPDCPLHDVRLLEPVAIIDWLDALSAEERKFLMRYHQCCLVINRENAAVAARQN